MGNYKFEEDKNNFGETRRLDTIHKEVQKIEKEIKNKKIHSQVSENNDTVFGINKKIAVIIVIVCAVFIICGCFVISKMLEKDETLQNGGNTSENILDSQEEVSDISCGIITEKNTKEISVLSVATGEIKSFKLSNSTIITAPNGGRISLKDLSRGDVVSVVLSDNGEAQQVRFPENAWYYQSVLGVSVDAFAMTAEIDGKEFNYNDETIFTSGTNDIYPGDIDETDIVTAYGIGSNLLSAKIEKTHGYLVFKNAEEIGNLSVKVDFGESKPVTNLIFPIPAGRHVVVVSGDNIDDYMVEAMVEEKQQFEVDLGKFSEALRITFNVNVDDYNVNINGVDYPPNTTEVAVSRGIYDIIITAEGYKDFITTVNCEKDNADVTAVLNKISQPQNNPQGDFNSIGTEPKPETPNQVQQGNLTIYTDPGWAKVYVDGEYIGVSPVMVRLDYGKHNVKAKDSEGNIEETDVNIDSPDKTVTLDF